MLIEHMPTLMHPHKYGAGVVIVLDVADAMQYSPTWDHIVLVGIMLYMVDDLVLCCKTRTAIDADARIW